MTTTEIYDFQTTGGYNVTSSSARNVVYFQCAVVFIGVVGTAANTLVLYAMIASKQHNKLLLIFNQNVFDLCSCLFLIVTYIIFLSNFHVTGTLGYWLCRLLLSENTIMCSINCSVINLLSVTIERYLKVVHPARSKKLLRKWVIYLVLAFAWISFVTYDIALMFSTSLLVL